MIVLGYNGFSRSAELFGRLYGHTADSVDRHAVAGHDSAAALFVDGALVAAVEEERMNRRKKTSAFPANAMRWCVRRAGITFDDVDHVAFGWSFDHEYLEMAIGAIAESAVAAEHKLQAFGQLNEVYTSLYSRAAIIQDFTDNTGYALPEEKLVCVPHHLAHLACGRTVAGFADCAFFVSDGKSEHDSAIMGEVRDGKVKVFDQCTIGEGDSIALLYQNVTRYLGFTPNNDEYKVMGLAGFGTAPDPRSNPFMAKVVVLEPAGRFSLALPDGPRGMRMYYTLFDELFDGAEDRREDFEFRVRVASAMQQVVELVTAHQLRALADMTDQRNLIFEGGLALNCVNNAKLLAGLPFDRVEVSFAAGDPGVAIGAAAHVVMETSDSPVHTPSPYLGPEYDADEIRSTLETYASSLAWEQLPAVSVAARTAELLVGKTIVGWFQGRTEYGPRALGNRCILANPSYPDMKDIINNRVKHREPFRPFAPIVLEQDAARVFELGKKDLSPYMTFVFAARPEYRERVAAATHVDGTSRIQTVTDHDTPRLAELLREFASRTDVPCLVSTSFNVAGEPIVCSPRDAVECYLGTDIDYLVIGDFLVSKR